MLHNHLWPGRHIRSAGFSLRAAPTVLGTTLTMINVTNIHNFTAFVLKLHFVLWVRSSPNPNPNCRSHLYPQYQYMYCVTANIITVTKFIYEDNDGARRLAMSAVWGKKRARHLSIEHHYVYTPCMEGMLTVKRVPTREQTADLLMKGSHTRKDHEHLQEKRGMVIYNQMCKSGGRVTP